VFFGLPRRGHSPDREQPARILGNVHEVHLVELRVQLRFAGWLGDVRETVAAPGMFRCAGWSGERLRTVVCSTGGSGSGTGS
jgi:hypothetical protein